MKYINLFETQAAYDAAEKYYPNTSYIEASDEVVYQETDPDYYLKQYLTFEALESGTFTLTVPAVVDSTYMTSISYSVDDGANWTTTTIDNNAQTITTPTIAQGGKVLWKGVGNQMGKSVSNGNYSYFSSTGNFSVSGNIMSLLYGDNFANQTSFASGSSNNCVYLFKSAAKLVNVDNLALPATTLAANCYLGMFNGCTSLTTAPSLSATTLAQYCYSGMFNGCTSLTTAPTLPATTLADGCYDNMFSNCTSLTTAPELPATNLESLCYNEMFNGCTSLTTAPELPATTLKQKCYSGMFYNCTSLTTAPALNATTMQIYCYQYMFKGCTGLTTAPELPATTLVSKCYLSMFQNCTNLNSITMLATSISASDCLKNWVQGVAATGTFTKAAEMTTLETGYSGIPSGWTVVDA